MMIPKWLAVGVSGTAVTAAAATGAVIGVTQLQEAQNKESAAIETCAGSVLPEETLSGYGAVSEADILLCEETAGAEEMQPAVGTLPAVETQEENQLSVPETGNTQALTDLTQEPEQEGSTEAAEAAVQEGEEEEEEEQTPEQTPAAATGSEPSAAPQQAAVASAAEAVPTPAPASAAVQTETEPVADYNHTTQIYLDDDETLCRVEYYDENNNLIRYSDVVDYDSETGSYTENIYSYDWDNGVEILERTDSYVGGEIVSSQTVGQVVE